MPSRSNACPQALTYMVLAASVWNMNRLHVLPRNSSELQPVLKKSVRVRCDTCAIAKPEAELISPIIATTLSRSIRLGLGRRRLRIDAVFSDQVDFAAHDPAGGIDLVDREIDPHHRIFAQWPQKAGARRQVADADRVRLGANDGGKSSDAQGGGRTGSLEQTATATACRRTIHETPPRDDEKAGHGSVNNGRSARLAKCDASYNPKALLLSMPRDRSRPNRASGLRLRDSLRFQER